MSSFSALKNASPELLNWLHEAGQTKKITHPSELIREGEIHQKLFLLLDGQLRVSSSNAKDRSDVLADLMPGSMVGEMSWLEQRPAVASINAEPGALVLEVPCQRLDRLQDSDASLAAQLQLLIAQKLAIQIQEQNAWVHPLKEMPQIGGQLRKVLVLFAGLEEQDIYRLAELGQRQYLPPGAWLLKQQGEVLALHLIMSGDAEIFLTLSGDTQVVGQSCRGEILGEMAFLLNDQRGASAGVRSKGGMDLLNLDRSLLSKELQQDANFAFRFYRGLACMLSQRSRDQLLRHQRSIVSQQVEQSESDQLEIAQLSGISRAARHFDWLCRHFQGEQQATT